MRRVFYAAVLGLFLLTTQLAAAADLVGLHGDLTPHCKTAQVHFCAEQPDHDANQCAVCHFNSVGVCLPLTEKFQLSDEAHSVPVAVVAGSDTGHEFSSASPRAPPTLGA